MEKSFLFVLALLTALTTIATSTLASGGHPPTKEEQAAMGAAALSTMGRGFSAEEKSIIEKYFEVIASDEGGKNKGKKHRGLPPGLAMQLQKNGRLPPGLEKRDLPDDLLSRLSSCRKNGECTIVGTDVLLVEAGTQVILDVINNAVKP
jgi:hypothetical protein